MDVIPYLSVGLLKFGMPAEQVEVILGTPLARTRNFLRELKLIYNGFNVEFDENGVGDVTFRSPEGVTINGETFSNDRNGADAIISKSQERFQGNGSIILMDLGIAISDDPNLPYPLTIFARGRMDSLIPTYRRF